MAPKCRLGRTFPSIQPKGCFVDSAPVRHHPATAPYNTDPIQLITPSLPSPDTPAMPSPDTPAMPSPDTPAMPSPDTPNHPLDSEATLADSPMVPERLEFAQDTVVPDQVVVPVSKPARRIVPIATSDDVVPLANNAVSIPKFTTSIPIPTGQPSHMHFNPVERMNVVIDRIVRKAAVLTAEEADNGAGLAFNIFADDAKSKEYNANYVEPADEPITSDDDESTDDRTYIKKSRNQNIGRGVRVKRVRIRRKQLNPRRAK